MVFEEFADVGSSISAIYVKIYHLNGSSPNPGHGGSHPNSASSTSSSSSSSASPGTVTGKQLQQGRDSGPGVYHSHLHASLQAFSARKWRPLSPDTISASSSITRCRPISARPSSASHAFVPHPPTEQRPAKADTSRETSAQSLGPSGHVTSIYPRRPDTPRVTYGNFDTLSPRILCHLVTDPRPLTPLSTYGDAIHTNRKRRTKRTKRRRNKTEEEIFNDSSSAFSASDDNVDEEEEEDSNVDENSDDDSDDNESLSELEKGREPALDHRRKVPDLQLRPEQLDHVYVPEHKRDMRRFDFDAEKTEIPVYDFECPIPSEFRRINFRLHAREKTDWRFNPANTSTGPENPLLTSMFDRLVEIERRQIETEEWEEKRLRAARRKLASRAGGSATSRTRDKRCCSSCLQPCCVGDCPNKRIPHPPCCETCHQPLCTGTCVETRYEQRMRLPRETQITSLPPTPLFPKNCRTCQKRHNAKYINANQLVLGRPKSAFSTYSRGRNSAKPKDLRPKSAMNVNVESTISKKIEQLGIDPVQQPRPTSSSKSSRPSSRNGLMPGKTYFSNLSHSLTDLTSKRRCKSAKTRRPKSVKVSKSIECNT